MQKQIETAILLDLYGGLLTKKQHAILDMYLNLDFSLSEIAENQGITRQAALFAVKHAQNKLEELEAALGVKQKFDETERALIQIEAAARDTGAAEEILAAVSHIRAAWGEE